MAIVPFSNVSTRGDTAFITTDAQNRLCLSAKLRRDLGLTNGSSGSIRLYLGYDKVNKRIGIAKPDIVRLTDTKPYKFDAKRGYAHARNFLRANEILPAKGKSARYVYDGQEDGWHTFKLDGYDAPDKAFKAKSAKAGANPKQ